MKRLLFALASAVAVSTVSARTASYDFESSNDFVSGDGATITNHPSGVTPPASVPYPCNGFGSQYLAFDADEALTHDLGDVNKYVDMNVKFTPSTSEADISGDNKLAIYQNAQSNLVIVACDASGVTNTYITPKVTADTWYRLTVASKTVNNKLCFNIYLDGSQLTGMTEGGTTATDFYSLAGGAALASVGFEGTGAIDNFVARTTDPFYAGPYAATIGTNDDEKFATYGEAIEDALAGGGTAVINYNGTTGNGTAANPYKIITTNDLFTLKDLVASCPAARSACYAQTADINMEKVGAFAGIGTYADNPTAAAGVPFSGTYDGQGYKISNVTFTDRDYAGIFNQVNGGTVQNLTVENLSFVGTGSKYSASIIGNAGNGATLKNLVATGSFGSAEKPGNHNMAGIAIRLSAGGTGTLVQNCTNNAAIYGNYTKLAGICAITQTKVSGGTVTFDGCVNNGSLNLSRTEDGVTGFAGIVGYVQDDTVLVGCSNTGSINNTASGANTDKNGALVGWAYGKALTDNGGNSVAKTDKMVGCQTAGKTPQSITGFKYATVDNNNVATTVTSLAKDTTYLLEGNVAASETPVFTLAAAGDTIAFDTALGYTFAGMIAGAEGLTVSDATVGTVTTYTAASAGASDWAADSTTVEGDSAAEAYPALDETELATADAKKLTDWAKDNSVAFSDVTAAPDTYVEAFILNCAPNAAAVAAAKEDFQSDLDITVNADGSVTIDEPTGDYNVAPQLEGSNNLTDWYPTSPNNNEDYQFFKWVLSL